MVILSTVTDFYDFTQPFTEAETVLSSVLS